MDRRRYTTRGASDMKTDPCRFCRWYAISLAAIAALIASVLCVQVLLLRAGGVEQGGALLLVSALRAVAPAATGSALSIALIAWAHPLSEGALRTDLPWALRRGALLTPAGFVAASVVGGALALLFGQALLGSAPRAALRAVALRDVGWGLVATCVDSVVVGLLGWRFLGVLGKLRLSLAGKLVVACTAVLPLRAVLGLVLESVLPG